MNRSTRHTPSERRWLKVLGTLNEYQSRLFVADKALDQGRGGISRLSELTGMSRMTITKAVAELNSGKKLAITGRGRIREAGGGRKRVEDADPALQVQLGKILEETSAGDPIGALAHLQLGRAFAISGDKIKAKAAYQDFLTLWKDADPDVPILI